jgi:AcrR family transcriptional regulator
MPRVSQDHLDNRRQQILDAARRCFARNGFHATSMQDVLTEANLSAGAVYRYFRGKEEIISAIATTAMATVATAFAEVSDEDPLPPLTEVFHRVFAAIEAMDPDTEVARTAVQVWGEALRNPQLNADISGYITAVRDTVRDTVRLYQRRGALPDDVPSESIARVLIALLPGFLVQRALFGDVDAAMFAEGLAALTAQPAPLR